MSGNLAFTSFRKTIIPEAVHAMFGDGKNHTLPYSVDNGAVRSESGCLSTPNLHAGSEAGAAGSAFAISYNANLSDVTMDNLVVFTVRKHTPFYRLATFDVPKDLPPCPEGGCTCAWLWVPNGCGRVRQYAISPGHS